MSRKAAAVSMDPALNDRAKQRAEELGFPTFSAYVAQLIRADLKRGGDFGVVADPPSRPTVKDQPPNKG